ncbi:hypothetical protein, partial [Klebsiella pneumoniae]|uniref:hypothetical protein n=1 Tax=Klebsiella pneumoniae TaxID=573 RepID=UPI00190F4F36
VSGTGFYTAPSSAGTASVKATVGGLTSTASVTITAVSPGVPTVTTPASATVNGMSASLSVLGSDGGDGSS